MRNNKWKIKISLFRNIANMRSHEERHQKIIGNYRFKCMNQSVYKYLPLSGCFISFFNLHFEHSGLHKNLDRYWCVCDSNGLILLFFFFDAILFILVLFCGRNEYGVIYNEKKKLSISTAFYLSSLIVVMMRRIEKYFMQ